jgi:4-hydroxyphenylacetate 3-monooxygenase
MYFVHPNVNPLRRYPPQRAKTRVKLFRLAFDAAVSSFSGRQQLYERCYSGDPVRLAGTLYGLYDKDTYVDRIFGLLDDVERRQRLAGAASHI